MKISEEINSFSESLKQEYKAPNTIKAYTRDIAQVFEPSMNTTLIDQKLIDKIQNEIKSNNNSNQTVARKFNSLNKFIHYLLSEGVIKNTITINFGGSTVSLRKQKILRRNEYLLLRETSQNDKRLYTIIELLLQTGMKISELSKICINDLRLESENPNIRITSTPKRIIPLNKKIRYILNDYLASYHDRKSSPKALFYTSRGKNFNVRNIRGLIDDVFKNAQIKDFTVNDLRNTFIVNQLEAGLPIDLVSKIVGHTNTLTTKRYLELLQEEYHQTGLKTPVEI